MTESHASGRVINILFHGIGRADHELDPGEAGVWIDLAKFERTLDRLVGRADVSISFDDGNVSDIELALPRLRDRGLRATFFVLAGRLGQSRHLSSGALRELQTAGMTIGSHGWDHISWRRLDPNSAAKELYDAPALLADVCGRGIDLVAIPFGDYGRATLSLLQRAGVRGVFTSDGGPARLGEWCQARNSVTAAWGEPQFDAALAASEPVATWMTRRAKRLLKRWR